MRRFLAATLMVLFAAAVCSAQDEKKNEIAVTVGRTFISDQTVPNTSFFDNTVHSGNGLSFDFNYARVLRRYKWGSLSAEVPVIWNPDEDLN
jgi:hypothetical protein